MSWNKSTNCNNMDGAHNKNYGHKISYFLFSKTVFFFPLRTSNPKSPFAFAVP